MVFKAAHLPTTPHTSATPVETVFTALWFYPSFYSFSDSLTWQVYQVCCVFHFLNKKLKWHLSHSFTKTWLSYPISALLLLDYWLHFGRINRLASTWECSPTRPCDSSPISLFTSAPGGSRGSRARLLCPGLSRSSLWRAWWAPRKQGSAALSRPLSFFTPAHLVGPEEAGLGCFVQASLVCRSTPATLVILWKVKRGLNPLWQVGSFCFYVTDSWINNIT